jgi:predicted tellurium resistance membrane protein TerC
MDWIFSVEGWVTLVTLTVLELVLGIDNIIFITILAGKLPANQSARARTIGLALALITRILLLLSISFIARLTTPLFPPITLPLIGKLSVSGRDLILIVGGLFLIYKSTTEIHHKLEGEQADQEKKLSSISFSGVITQIVLLDIVFSLDSVITAIGMANEIVIMILAVIIALIVMLVAAGLLSNFVMRHPTVKMLALAFLLLIGTSLLLEGFHKHIEKGYIYFAMAFSVFVEMLNLRMKRKPTTAPIELHGHYNVPATK